MSGLALHYDFSGLARAEQRLEGLADFDRRRLLSLIGETGVSQTQLRFIDGEGPDGQAWPVSGRVREQGGQTLIDTARLRRSIGYQVSDDQVEIGTNVEYAAIHQFGGEIEPKSGGLLTFQIGGRWVSSRGVTIPARPFLGVSASDEAEFDAVIEDFFAEVLP